MEDVYTIQYIDIIYVFYIWLCSLNFALPTLLHLKPVPHSPTTPLSHWPTLLQLHLYDVNCEPDSDRDKRREACIVGSGKATEGYRPYGRDWHKKWIILICIVVDLYVMDWIHLDLVAPLEQSNEN